MKNFVRIEYWSRFGGLYDEGFIHIKSSVLPLPATDTFTYTIWFD